MSDLLKCPKCGSEHWRAVVTIDLEDDEVGSYANTVTCHRCGELAGVLQLTGRSLPQPDLP